MRLAIQTSPLKCYSMRHIHLFLIVIVFVACHRFDSSKIIEPTDYQIQSVSFNLDPDVVPTNMAAQPMEDNENFTLVGASLRQGNDELVGLWLFNNLDSTDIRSVNQTAQNFSVFPELENTKIRDEATNLMAFLDR